MSVKTHNFRIGLFVLAGAALFVGALFAVGLKAYFGKRDIFETYVTGKVENLSVGALVKLRGVTIGKVSSIEFAGSEYPPYGEQYVLIRLERALRSSSILFVAHFFHPVHGLAIDLFLDGDVRHGGCKGGAVPMLFARWEPDDVAGTDFFNRSAPVLNPAAASRDD
jgi:hypothetical protein